MPSPRNWTAAQIRQAEQTRTAVNRNAGMSARDAHVAAARSVNRQIEDDQNAAYDAATDDEGNPR